MYDISKDRLCILRSMRYEEYIRTREWKRIRKLVLDRDDHKCRVCNSIEDLHVHHREYSHYGTEDLNTLTTLCSNCHNLFHNESKLSKKRWSKETERVRVKYKAKAKKRGSIHDYAFITDKAEQCSLCPRIVNKSEQLFTLRRYSLYMCRSCHKNYCRLKRKLRDKKLRTTFKSVDERMNLFIAAVKEGKSFTDLVNNL